jgi:hypothetical protein
MEFRGERPRFFFARKREAKKSAKKRKGLARLQKSTNPRFSLLCRNTPEDEFIPKPKATR